MFVNQVRMKGISKLYAMGLSSGEFRRLMIPCMMFSLSYFNSTQPVLKTSYGTVNGVGHMWF